MSPSLELFIYSFQLNTLGRTLHENHSQHRNATILCCVLQLHLDHYEERYQSYSQMRALF